MNTKRHLRHSLWAMLLVLNLLSITLPTFANDVSIARYLPVSAKPQNHQQHLLQQQIDIHFPRNILTLKQAIQFMLQFSRYHLAAFNQMDIPAQSMLKQTLPEVDKIFEPMSLQQGLITLAGNIFYLLVDPIQRLVSFKIKPQYRTLYERVIEKNNVNKLKKGVE